MGTLRKVNISVLDGLWDIRETIRGLSMAPSIASEEPYGTGPRKPYIRRLADTITWALRYHEPHEFYNLYEMDLVESGIDPETILPKHRFMLSRDWLNLGDTINQATVLRDKRLFGICMREAGIPTPHNYGVMSVGEQRSFYDFSLSHTINPADLTYPLFVKINFGESGEGVHRVASADELINLEVGAGDYILQEAIVQYPVMNQLGPSSVNTLRIATILTGDTCEILGAIARCGQEGTGNVDNTSSGGMAIGITDEGVLQGSAYRDPEFGGRLSTHPDTGVAFDGFQVPYYSEALDLVCRAHRALPRIATIGWDVAITPDGPILIEGNDNYEIHSLQMCNGKGLREKWEEFYAKRSTELPTQFRHIHV